MTTTIKSNVWIRKEFAPGLYQYEAFVRPRARLTEENNRRGYIYFYVVPDGSRWRYFYRGHRGVRGGIAQTAEAAMEACSRETLRLLDSAYEQNVPVLWEEPVGDIDGVFSQNGLAADGFLQVYLGTYGWLNSLSFSLELRGYDDVWSHKGEDATKSRALLETELKSLVDELRLAIPNIKSPEIVDV